MDQTSKVSSLGRSRRQSVTPLTDTPRDPEPSIERFLVALARTGNYGLACQAGTLTRREVAALRARDHAFSLALDEAMDDAADMLEAEAWRRALEGVAAPVVKGGKLVFDPTTGEALMVRRYSDSLLMLLLRGTKPGKFSARPKAGSEHEDMAKIIEEIAADDDPPRQHSQRVR